MKGTGMLRRDRQIRTQVLQLRDVVLFSVALWLAHLLRSAVTGVYPGFDLDPIVSFDHFHWLYLIIVPGVPLILESQGFYQRQVFSSRRETSWVLAKSCFLAVIGVILVMFLRREDLARSVIIMFGAISFLLVWLAEELLRIVYRSRIGQA